MKVSAIRQGIAPKLVNGTLPDIDSDFCGKDRPKIKSYMEARFGKTQVVSVGTLTTLQLKGLIKELCRIVNVPPDEANYITSMIGFKDTSLLDLIKTSATEPKLKAFLKSNSDLVYMMNTLLDQPKSLSIHACAMIIFPDVMKSTEWCPVRKQQGLIVTEWAGGEMDDAGFLKDDILGIKQLDKFDAILDFIKANGKEVPNIYDLPHDDEVFRYFSNGWNGDVFQMGSAGLTEYSKSLKPENINDLVAAVALYRPGTMENHYHEIYVKCKNEGREVKYIRGTEEITKETFGLIVYQEQVMQIFQQIGGLTMKEADDVRRALGKKNLKYILPWKEKVIPSFKAHGFTDEEFESTWGAIEEFAKYSFNKSHSACYGMTAYVCQYLKVHYPIEYWTASLHYADGDDTAILNYLSEIMQAGTISIKPPDVNKSLAQMESDQETSSIFWGIMSIKGIGEDTANQIIAERNLNGRYDSFEDFYLRHKYTGSKVKKQTYEALISAGAFDDLYGYVGEEHKRSLLLNSFREDNKIKVSNTNTDIYINGQTHERWWWLLLQKKLTGLAFIDYQELTESAEIETPFCNAREAGAQQHIGIFRSFGGYVSEIRISKSKRGNFARLKIESNYRIYTVILWAEEYKAHKKAIDESEKRLILFEGEFKFDPKYTKSNQFTVGKKAIVKVL